MKPNAMVLSVLALGGALGAQAQSHVYFVPSTTVPAANWCIAAPPGCCLDQLTPRDVSLVSKLSCQDCARKVAPLAAWNTLVGDADGDADYHDNALFESIDALLIKRDANQNMRRMFVSPSAQVRGMVSGAPGLRPGDVAAVVRNAAGADGRFLYFLRVEHVRDAFGIAGPLATIDVDAIAQDDAGNIYLSLNMDKNVNVRIDGVVTARVLHDGGVGVIPAAAITYDAAGNVSAVVASGGVIALSEPAVDAMVALAGFQDSTFACVNNLNNLTALEIDRDAACGPLTVTWGTATFNFSHLIFGGDTLVMGLLTTCGGGAIAKLGTTPCPMGRSCGEPVASIGFEFGVLAPASVHALAIADEPEPYHLVLDTCTPEIVAPGALLLGVEYPHLPAAVALSLAPLGAAGVATSWPTPWGPAAGFPDLYPSGLLHIFPLLSSTLNVVIPAGVVSNLVFQAVELHPVHGLELSAPITVVVR